jgi:hypothetical protein
LASDLPPEQLAAITTVTPVEQETPAVESAQANSETTEQPGVQAVHLPEAVVAYVPGIDDTQSIPPVVEDPETVTDLVAVPELAVENAPAVETLRAVPEEAGSISTVVPEAEHRGPQPQVETNEVAVDSATSEETQALLSVAPSGASDRPQDTVTGTPEVSIQAVEAAAAVAVGASVASIAHVLHQHASIEVPPQPTTENQRVAVDAADLDRGTATPADIDQSLNSVVYSDVAEAASTDGEQKVAAVSAVSSITEGDHDPSNPNVQGINDTKLADAVARAFEHLKPQIITEIIKQLSK